MEPIRSRKIEARDLIAFVESRGYQAAPVTNTTAAAEGNPLEVVGYELSGPRGNKTFIPKDRDGLLSLDEAELWADAVDYATERVSRRRDR